MRLAELLGPGPGLEGRLALPDGVRGIQRVVLGLGSFQQMEFDEARHLAEIAVAALPDALECFFRSFDDPEAVHGDEHSIVSLCEPIVKAASDQHTPKRLFNPPLNV